MHALNRWDHRDCPGCIFLPPIIKACCAQSGNQVGLHRDIWYRNKKDTKDSAQGSFLSEVTCHIIGPRLYSESGKLHSLAMVTTRVTFCAVEHLSL